MLKILKALRGKTGLGLLTGIICVILRACDHPTEEGEIIALVQLIIGVIDKGIKNLKSEKNPHL